jgi:hypothetical protein
MDYSIQKYIIWEGLIIKCENNKTVESRVWVAIDGVRIGNRMHWCKIWGFHGGDYEECRLQGCDAVWLLLSDISEDHIASIITVKRVGSYKRHGVTIHKTAFFFGFIDVLQLATTSNNNS